MKQVIVIDGVVGCGKTSLGNIIEESKGIKLYRELSDDDTYNLLNEFYADKKRWSFTLQIHFLNQRFKMIKEIHKNCGGLLDRSIFGDRIFAEMLNEDGDMSDEEYRTYSTLLDNMLEHAAPPTLLIYLQCNTDTAIKRINKRNRGLESQVERGYWERLNQKYEEWYKNYDISKKILINVDNIDITTSKGKKEILNIINPYLK